MPEDGKKRRSMSQQQAAMKSLVLRVAPAGIAWFKAVVESYDNLVTLRTEDPRNHHLRMWFAAASEEEVRGLLEALGRTMPIEFIE